MAQLNPPRIVAGGISREVYVVTHGKEVERSDGTVWIDSSRKYKATDDFKAVAAELGWTPPETPGPVDQPDGTIE